jgi:hypothetical protein
VVKAGTDKKTGACVAIKVSRPGLLLAGVHVTLVLMHEHGRGHVILMYTYFRLWSVLGISMATRVYSERQTS